MAEIVAFLGTVPSLPEIEHIFFEIAKIVGASEMILLALGALTLLFLKLLRLAIDEVFDVIDVIQRRRRALLPRPATSSVATDQASST